jgi:hypothetical protein
MTAAGKAWLNLGAISQRERVRFDVRFDPALGRFEWPGNERQAFADKEAWTIDLPTVEDRELLARKPELGALVRNEGLPDDEDRAPADRRKQVDLLALAIVSRRTHWRSVRIDLWQKTGTSLQQLIASVNGAEHERLTLLMAGYRLDEVRRRVVAPVRR